MFGIIPLLAAAGRLHGIGGSLAKWSSRVIILAVFALVNYLTLGVYFMPLAFVGVVGMALGHGNFFKMHGANPQSSFWGDEQEQIERSGGRWLWLRLGLDPYSTAYSMYCFAIKGAIIGMGCPPVGLLAIVIWPLSYLLSFRLFYNSPVAEYLTLALLGVGLATYLHFTL